MAPPTNLKAKLGKNVFKTAREPHIRIRPGFEKDPRLRASLYVCPAGLYSETPTGEIELEIDGCLECGNCRIACGTEDRLIDASRKFRDWLKSKEVRHTGIETPGAHTWMVWRRNLADFASLLFQEKATS